MAVGWEPVLMVSVGVIVPSLLRRLAGHVRTQPFGDKGTDLALRSVIFEVSF
jgi:hypothetical protein